MAPYPVGLMSNISFSAFETLPKNVHTDILKELPISDLLKIRLINKRFKRICGIFFQNEIAKSEAVEDPFASLIPHLFTAIGDLYQSGRLPDELVSLRRPPPPLFSFACLGIVDEEMEEKINYFATLEKVKNASIEIICSLFVCPKVFCSTPYCSDLARFLLHLPLNTSIFKQSIILPSDQESARFKSYFSKAKEMKDGTSQELKDLFLQSMLINNEQEACEMALIAGANPNYFIDNRTPLVYWAVAKKREHLLRLLLKYGAEPNIYDSKGETPLLCAVALHSPALVTCLLDYGASTRECYPLHYAAFHGFIDIVKVILLYDRDVDYLDTHGFTPIDYARRAARRDVELLLDRAK